MKVSIHNVRPSATAPEVVDGRLALYAGKPAIIYHDQITEVDLGCIIELPNGYIGLFEPENELITISSVLCENSGIVSGVVEGIRLRKGTNGSVKIKTGDSIGYLTLVKVTAVEL